MIKLKNILKEFDFGEKLWADDAYGSSSGPYRSLIKRMYKGEYEKDTPEEMELWSAIKDYLKNADKDGVSSHRSDIKQLLSLKKQFPLMLDPATKIKAGDTIYRGMTGQLDKIVKYIDQATSIEQYGGDSRWLMLRGVAATLRSRSDQGFISATWKERQAKDFGIMNQKNDRYPIVGMSAYGKVAGRSIISPKFATILSGYDEGEFWILGNKMMSQNLLIADPSVYGVFKKKDHPEYENTSGVILSRALIARFYNAGMM
jgi:hypothetical protein